MSLTSASIAENIRNELENLLDFVMSDEQEQQTAYLAECNIWKGVLLLGKLLMQLFLGSICVSTAILNLTLQCQLTNSSK